MTFQLQYLYILTVLITVVLVSGCIGHVTPKPVCESHSLSRCDSGHLYWFDSCGNRQERKEYCDNGCSDGACITPPVCTNECHQYGAKECTDSSHYKTCGNYNSDSCLEWSTVSACPPGQTCSNGQCACTNECSPNGLTEPIKLGELITKLPDPLLFSPKIYSLPNPLKLAFVELEPANPGEVEVTSTSFLRYVQEFKTFMEEISNGKQSVDTNYRVLPKETTNETFDYATQPSVFSAVNSITQKYKDDPTLKGYLIVIYIDTSAVYPYASCGGSKDTNYNAVFFGNSYINETETFVAILTHELLHKSANTRDAYVYCHNTFPLVSYRVDDLYGWNALVHPFGQIKAQMGWKEYTLLNTQPGSSYTINIDNSCLPDSKIVKFPLGYVVDNTEDTFVPYEDPGFGGAVCFSSPKLLLKSMLIELRGKSTCKYESLEKILGSGKPSPILGPGVWLFYVYETVYDAEYSYQVPWNGTATMPPDFYNYFALTKTAETETLEQKRLTETSNPDFDFKILNETWSNGRLDSSIASLTVKNHVDDSALRNIMVKASIYNVKNSAIMIKVDTNYDNLSYFLTISSEPPLTLTPLMKSGASSVFCLGNYNIQSSDAINLCMQGLGSLGINNSIDSISHYYIKSDKQNLNITLSNYVEEQKLTIPNILK